MPRPTGNFGILVGSRVSYGDGYSRFSADTLPYNAKDFGAKGDGVADDQKAINDAIAVCQALGGGEVRLPPGIFRITQPIIIPVSTSAGITLRGSGMRSTFVFPNGPAATFANGAILVGAVVPDASGVVTNITQYHEVRDLQVTCTGIGAGAAVGVKYVETEFCRLTNVIIDGFAADSATTALYLRGSTTAGLGAAAAPHVWRCNFTNVVAVGGSRGLVCENVDESSFFHCNFGVVPGATGAVIAVELIQFHNARFYSLLLSGDNAAATRPNYTGLKMNAPVNGDCIGLHVYGVVAEGFETAVLFGGGNGQDAWVYGLNAAESVAPAPGNHFSFNNGSNDGVTSQERKNNVHIYLVGSAQLTGVQDYHSGAEPEPETITLVMNGGGAFAPDVRGSNSFATSTNTVGSTITDFLDNGGAAKPGKTITVRLDANITLVHNAALLRCPGAVNLAGAAHKIVTLKRLGGLWYVTSVSAD